MEDPSEKSSSAAPKRDKFASMAAATEASLSDHDKLASMAVASQSSTPSTETTTVVQRGDKVASMAVSHPAAAAAPKRGKFASMIASAAAAANLQVKPPTTTTPPEKDAETLIKERIKQRDKVLKDLEQAEGWTWQLLNLASQTAISLSDLTADIVTDISEASHKYRETLQKIHSTLTPHAHLVVPYQNHNLAAPVIVVDDKEKGEKHDDHDAAQEKERINMYAARVEMRLAQERRNVVKEFLRLEKESDDSSSPLAPSSEAVVGDKRKRDD